MKQVNGEEVDDGSSRFSSGDEFCGGICSLQIVGKLVRSEDLLLMKWFVTISDSADAICLLKSASLWKISSNWYIFRSAESELLKLKFMLRLFTGGCFRCKKRFGSVDISSFAATERATL